MKSCFDIGATVTEWIYVNMATVTEWIYVWIYDNADEWDILATLSNVWALFNWENCKLYLDLWSFGYVS